MGFSQGTQYTFKAYANETDSSVPTNASAGSGGGDMPSWTYSRVNKLDALVRTTYSMGTTSHSISTGAFTNTNFPFNVGGVPGGEESHTSTPSGGESGSGGGEMPSWAKPRDSKIQDLVRTTYSIGTSSHSIPTAVANTNAAFDVGGVPNGEESNAAVPAGGRVGIGGGDMSAWSESRPSKLNALVVTSYSMGTTKHTLSKAFVNSATTPFGVGGVPSGEESHSKTSKGVTYGPNYFNLLMKGKVRAAPNADPTKPNPVLIGDATVKGFHTNSHGTKYSFSTSQKPDGTYGLSVSDYGIWTVSSSREYLGKQTKEVNIQSKTTSGVDFLLNLGASARHARGIGIGTGAIGFE